MRRYYFELTNDRYESFDCFIPDGSNKKAAVNKAKKWMSENNVKNAVLAVNSMITDNLLDVIDIELD